VVVGINTKYVPYGERADNGEGDLVSDPVTSTDVPKCRGVPA